MEDYKDNERKFWEEATPEVQDKNFDIFIKLIEIYKSKVFILYKIFSASNKGILQKHSVELINLMDIYKEDTELSTIIWEALGDQQKECKIFLADLLDKLINKEENISDIWKNTNKEIQSEILQKLLEKYKNSKEVILQIFKGTNIELSEKQFEVFFKTSESAIKEDELTQTYNIYKQIYKINNDINETINPEIFCNESLRNVEIEKLARITIYPDLQEKLIKISKNKGLNKLITTIDKNSNWIMEIDNVLKNINNYKQLLEELSNKVVDEDTTEMLIQVFSQKENYFNISGISEAQNYFDIRKEICQKILNNEKVDNLSPTLANYTEEDKKRFAILEMMYGIDMEEAENLIQKYAKDIEKMDTEKYERKTILALLGIKRILECKNIEEKYNENKNIIDNELETIEYSTIATLEANCINMYAKNYNEILYKPKEEDIISNVEYEGKSINIYEIDEDFNIFVRAEGACNGWEEPENFNESLKKPRTKYHGNCKSFIGQDLIAIASSKGVKYAYTKCEKDSLLLSAPWDIQSNSANTEFSTASTKSNETNGVQFRIPTEMKNNTRYEMNEFVSENLVYKDQKFEADRPQFVLYVQEPDIDRETDEQWRIAKKAAGQIGIDILVIDRERFAQKEWQKIEKLQSIFLGKEENNQKIPETELLEKIIVKFENNNTGIRGSEVLRDKYFTAQQRNEIIGDIWGKIKSLKNLDFNRYVQLLDKFVEVITNEEQKTYTNTGFKINQSRYSEKIIDTLKQKQKDAMEEAQSKKIILMEKYKEFGIEKIDMINIIEFLKKEKGERSTEEWTQVM